VTQRDACRLWTEPTALALVVVLTVMFPPAANGSDVRLPAGTPQLFPPGFVFGFQQNLRNPEVLARLGRQIATASRRDHAVAVALATMANTAQQGLPKATADEIARFAADSYGTVADIVVEVQFLGLVAGHDPELASLVDGAMETVTLFTGGHITLPLRTAPLGHSNVMHLVDREMAGWSGTADVAGFYSVKTRGACPRMPRTVEMQQFDYMVEAVTDDRLVLFGAVGEGHLYLVANGQRRARRHETANGPHYEVPDQPRERLTSQLGEPGTPIVLTGDNGDSCMLTLSPTT
jgi:hypothetical protein